MGFCSSVEHGFLNDMKEKEAVAVGTVLIGAEVEGAEARRTMINYWQDEVFRLSPMGPSDDLEHALLRLAHLTNATWYLRRKLEKRAV